MESSFSEHVLERAGCPLHYWVGGPEGRPLVVFSHGACADHHAFDPHTGVVAREYRVVNWDARGHGDSQPMGEPFTIPLAVEDLLAIVDSLGYERATFVGHSNGTYIGQELAFRYPERVTALVVADGTCITWPLNAFDRFVLRISPAVAALFPYETLKRSGLASGSLKSEVQEYTYRAFSRIPKNDFLMITRGVTNCLHPEPDYRIAQPLLLVHGADDAMGNIRRIAPAWAAREPNCQYEVIPNARHFATLDDPERFNELLLGFLAKWADPRT